MSAWVPSKFSDFLPLSKDMRLEDSRIGDPKLKLGVNVQVNGCLSLYFGAVTSWQLVIGVPNHTPKGSWDVLQPPHNLVKGEEVDGWMNR